AAGRRGGAGRPRTPGPPPRPRPPVPAPRAAPPGAAAPSGCPGATPGTARCGAGPARRTRGWGRTAPWTRWPGTGGAVRRGPAGPPPGRPRSCSRRSRGGARRSRGDGPDDDLAQVVLVGDAAQVSLGQRGEIVGAVAAGRVDDDVVLAVRHQAAVD